MNIPLLVNLAADGIIIDGPHRGTPHHYKSALFNTLIALRPKVCLEIGTLHGGTAVVFERYFREYCPDGFLVTADIKLYCNLNRERIIQVKVYPHVEYFNDLHNVDESDLLPDGARLWRSSVELNTRILSDELHRLHLPNYDFAYVDGDHRRASLEKDLQICRALLKPPCYILLDDAVEGLHESSAYYQEVISKEWQHYDFEDWPVLSGCALIWEKIALP